MSAYGILLLLYSLTVYCLIDSSAACAGFVSNCHTKQERVEEWLQNATDEPTTDAHHFWLSGYHAQTLVTLKDRAWRGVLLLDLCRSTLCRINEAIFQQGHSHKGSMHCLEFAVAWVLFETSSCKSLFWEPTQRWRISEVGIHI